MSTPLPEDVKALIRGANFAHLATLMPDGSPQVAEPLGWIETRLEGAPTSLAILSRYLRLATDGWTLAATSVLSPPCFQCSVRVRDLLM